MWTRCAWCRRSPPVWRSRDCVIVWSTSLQTSARRHRCARAATPSSTTTASPSPRCPLLMCSAVTNTIVPAVPTAQLQISNEQGEPERSSQSGRNHIACLHCTPSKSATSVRLHACQIVMRAAGLQRIELMLWVWCGMCSACIWRCGMQ